MDRNNSRYTFRRQERQSQHNHSNTGLSTSSSHDELIRFVREAWQMVSEQGTPVIDCNETDQLKNFKPFNLEEFWGRRLVQNIQISQGQQ